MSTLDRVVAAAAAYVGAAALAGRRRGPKVCPYRLLTGLPCPACGLTRSIGCAARLDLRSAHTAHPAGPTIAVLILALTAVRLARQVGPSRLLGRAMASAGDRTPPPIPGE
jgi:Protein of unknown function (DUF2752)